MNKTPLVLVDGSSYLYRAFHAMPPLNNSKGQPTGAVKGVINMLRSLKKSYPESVIAVIFDAKGKTFRDEIYPQYKANRPSMPDELRQQIEPIYQIIEAMGLPLISIEGVEADDVIGSYCKMASDIGLPVVVSTGDKDMAQLVNEQVSLVNTMTESVLTPATVPDKFGVGAELIIDLLALMGDKVDNIPGVAGVGEKTALALLQGIGGLDAIYANLDKIKDLSVRGAKTLADKMLQEKDNAYLSYQLATIKCDVDLPIKATDLVQNAPDMTRLQALYQDLEFKSWIGETEQNALASAPQAPAAAVVQCQYQTILSQAAFAEFLSQLQQSALFAFDTETTSLDYMQAQLVGLSFAFAAGQAVYIPVGHSDIADKDMPLQLPRDVVLGALKPILENPQQLKIGQNLKYDSHVLLNYGIALQGIAFDTMLESYVYNSVATRHNMDDLSEKYLNHTTISFEDVAGKGKNQLTFDQVQIQQAAQYAAEDADITLRLHHYLWPEIEKQASLAKLFKEIEMPLVAVLTAMEHAGILLDKAKLSQQSQALAEEMTQAEQAAFVLAGQEFNLNSPKQLREILFDKLGIKPLKKTPTGEASTAEPVLQELAEMYELPALIMQYRSLSKLKSTYTDALPKQINNTTGRVHTSYHQAVASTGRLSSSDPNLQNIPIRTEQGRRVREAFIAAPGYKIVAADYSQVELRIMAHLSGDKGLLEAFQKGEDIHKATASEVFNTPLIAVSSEQRRSAKAINFGLIYGMSAFGLAKQLQIGRNQAQDYVDQYFAKYPGVRHYMDNIREQARQQGFVETLFGRRLYLPEIHDKNKMRQQAAERTAINAPMQGTAADIIKLAMISIHAWLKDSTLDAKMILQVHDELVFEVAEKDLEALKSGVRQRMQQAAKLDVPLIVDIGVGDNWQQAH